MTKPYIIICIKRGALCLAAASLCLSMAGCAGSPRSNYQNIENLQLIQTIGVDKGDSGVLLTVASGQSLEGQPSLTISREDDSLSAAMENIQDYSSKEELFYEHTRFAALGEDAARELLPDFFDYLTRSSRLKLDITVFVVKESRALSLLTQSGEMGYNATNGLASIETDARHRGVSYPYSAREILYRLADYGSALACAIIPVQTEGSVFTKDSGLVTSVPAGYAVIKDKALVAYIDAERSRAAGLLTNKSGQSAVTLELEEGQRVTVYTNSGGAEYDATWGEDGSLTGIQARLSLSCGIVELPDSLEALGDERARLDAISRAFGEKLLEDCEKVTLLSQELESDFLGLKGYLRAKYPEKVAALGEDFVSAMSRADISLSVDCSITRSFDFERAHSYLEGDDVQ